MSDEWVSVDKALRGFKVVLSEMAKQMKEHIESERKRIEEVTQYIKEVQKQDGRIHDNEEDNERIS